MKTTALLFPVLALILGWTSSSAQSYKALHGSVYGGGLAVYNNPASIINQENPWDLTILGTQHKAVTNLLYIKNYNLLKSADEGEFITRPGYYGRSAHYQSDVRLLNLRFTLKRKHAFGAGINIRNYLHLKTSPYLYMDSIQTTRDFLLLNEIVRSPMSVRATQASWGEFYFAYARPLYEDEMMRWTAGATVKIQRGLSGAFVRLSDGLIEPRHDGIRPYTVVTNAGGSYSYSSNYDRVNDEKESMQNVQDFMGHTLFSGSVDLGTELIIRYTNLAFEKDAPVYNWKMGISLLDIGQNRYMPGREGRSFAGLANEVVDTVLHNKFESVGSLADFNDSLATIARGIRRYNRNFSVWQPTRLVVNVDKHIHQHFYVNGEFSGNLSSAFSDKYYAVREMELLTVTPRWEKKTLGAYLPVQYTTDGKFWVGLAGKAGPVLLGFHHLGWLFGKNSMPNGGFYLAFTVKGWKFRPNDGIYACPPPL